MDYYAEASARAENVDFWKRWEKRQTNACGFILLYLIFLGPWRKLFPLCIKLHKSPGDILHPSIQTPVFIILCIEVILVTLALLMRDYSYVFPNGKKKTSVCMSVHQSHFIVSDRCCEERVNCCPLPFFTSVRKELTVLLETRNWLFCVCPELQTQACALWQDVLGTTSWLDDKTPDVLFWETSVPEKSKVSGRQQQRTPVLLCLAIRESDQQTPDWCNNVPGCVWIEQSRIQRPSSPTAWPLQD